MIASRHLTSWREVRSPQYLLFLVTLAVCLIRARDQPGVDLSIASTTATVVPGDVLLLALGVAAVAALLRSRPRRDTTPALVGAAALGALILVTAARNGTAAFVSGAKVVELSALMLGALAFVRSRDQTRAIVAVLVVFTAAADVVGGAHFLTTGGRQPAFLGEHDFAALATLPLLYGLALVLFGERDRLLYPAIVTGALGCVLAAALASLLGLYLGTVALVVIAAARRSLTVGRVAAVALVVGAITGGTLVIRAGDLGFLQAWFGKPETRPGQYASGWSQRLVYAYIGGRVFRAQPLIGTGWYGELPPKTFTVYLPDARARFPDQPPHYFPPADRPFVPQQAWDQILYELGLAGALATVVMLSGLARSAVRAARVSASAVGGIPLAWLAASVGALAGEGLFGGTPLAASFWLTAGVALALSQARAR